jgi:ABC-2 type transport system ATP-binding protein
MPVKRITGYLPEHNPLYLDLYVHEYLTFIGKIYGLSGTHLRARVGEMIERCGLTPEQNKKLEALSKGYRQRVGLAQSLIHDPKVLILDEPTSGLDPNQLAEIRKLIKDISLHKTVLFSTHIMQEVQALCDRVIIINKGDIVVDSMLSELLHQRGEHVLLVAEFAQEVSESTLTAIEGVIDVSSMNRGTYKLTVRPGSDVRASLFRMAADQNLALIGLRQEENSLEAIFQQLTQGVTADQ